MKAIISAILFSCVVFVSAAQETATIPLIEVQGYAERSISPDEAVFYIQLEEKAMKVSEATKILNTKTETLADKLKKAKIKDYKLVADNFAVDVNRIYRSGVSRDSGYVARQNLMVITSSKNEDLQKIAEAIQESGDMSFNLSFRVSEATSKSLENTLMTEALRNAQAQATLIAETLGIRSIRVHHVSLENSGYPGPVLRMMADSSEPESAQLKLAPDNQKIGKRVYVKFTY